MTGIAMFFLIIVVGVYFIPFFLWPICEIVKQS